MLCEAKQVRGSELKGGSCTSSRESHVPPPLPVFAYSRFQTPVGFAGAPSVTLDMSSFLFFHSTRITGFSSPQTQIDPFYLCINYLIKLHILSLPSSKSLGLTLNRTRPSGKWPIIQPTAQARNLEVILHLSSTLSSLISNSLASSPSFLPLKYIPNPRLFFHLHWYHSNQATTIFNFWATVIILFPVARVIFLFYCFIMFFYYQTQDRPQWFCSQSWPVLVTYLHTIPNTAHGRLLAKKK